MNDQPDNHRSLGNKRNRKRGIRNDNILKHHYRHMNKNIIECLNEYLKANNKEELKFVKLPKVKFSEKQEKQEKQEEQQTTLAENYRQNEQNQSVIDFLYEQPEIKDFLNKNFQEVYNTYYTNKKKSNELQKLPFTTNKFVSIEQLNKIEEKQLQQLKGLSEDENWILSEDYFNKNKKVIQKFVLSIKQEINDKLDELNYKGQKLMIASTEKEFFKKDTKVKDFWNRETRTTKNENKENMEKTINNIMQYEPIKNILEGTLGERLNEYCKNKIPNDETTISEKEESGKNEISNNVTITEEEQEQEFCPPTSKRELFCNYSPNIGENGISVVLNSMTTNETQCETMKDEEINLNSNHELPKDKFTKKINSNQNSETISVKPNDNFLFFEDEREDK